MSDRDREGDREAWLEAILAEYEGPLRRLASAYEKDAELLYLSLSWVLARARREMTGLESIALAMQTGE